MAAKGKADKEVKMRQAEGHDGGFHGVLTTMVENMLEDKEKFYDGGNKAAGRRLRKGLQDIRKACKSWREGVQQRVAGL